MAYREDIENSLSGQLLIAMPGMADPRFEKSVIFVCAHSADGAMGLIVNKSLDAISFPDLLEQLGVTVSKEGNQIDIQTGGPVESSRGFVLHSPDYIRETTLVVDEDVALTATIDSGFDSHHRYPARYFRRFRSASLYAGPWLCGMGAGTAGYGNPQ